MLKSIQNFAQEVQDFSKKYIKTSLISTRFLKFRKFGEIVPNLVTVVTTLAACTGVYLFLSRSVSVSRDALNVAKAHAVSVHCDTNTHTPARRLI